MIEQSPGFLANLHKMAKASEAWDGTDPVRLLTADGRVQ